MNIKIAAPCFALLLCQSAWADKFTLAVLPDTQCEVNYNPPMYTSQMNWIAANKTTLNIPYVIHIGDVVDWTESNFRMWISGAAGFTTLDNAGIPYAICVGNHDTAAVMTGGSAAPGNVNTNLRNTTVFNSAPYFPVSRFTTQQGRYESGKSDNAWYTFNAGGVDWLVLTLECWARQGAVDWAKTIVSSHPTYNVIIATHSHLNGDGTIKQDNGGYGDTSCQSIYDQLIKQYANVLMVVSGHVDSSAWRNDVGVNGNHIYQLLQDYQLDDNGGGYIRLIDIDTTARTISARMYSPFYNITKTDSSAFSFSGVNFIHTGLSETELLTVAGTSGDTHRIIDDPAFSGGEATILDATAVGDYVSYDVPAITAGTYDVRVGVKKFNPRGIFQLEVSRLDGTGGTSFVGPAYDEYSASTVYTEVDLGNWTAGSTSDKAFKFVVTGKNASSSGYSIAFDYIKLNPQITVPNSGFEAPVTSTFVYNPTGGSWTFDKLSPGGSGISANNSGFTSGNPAAPEGVQVGLLQDAGVITQTLTGFIPGTVYTVTFSAAQRNDGQTGQTWNVTIDGGVIKSFAPAKTATSYVDYTATFTATAASHTLGFVGTNLNGGDNTVFLDNVRVKH